MAKIAEGFSDDFRRCGLARTSSIRRATCGCWKLSPRRKPIRAAIEAVAHFCDVHLGKGVVFAKDTPNFIANRIGTFSVLNVMRLMQEMDLTHRRSGRADRQAVGWPKSATFRTIDLVGLDILGTWSATWSKNVQDERCDLKLPDFFKQMLERKWLGDKTKGGFYKKGERAPAGRKRRLALDWKTLEYHPRQKAEVPCARHGEEYRGHGRAAAHAARPEGEPAERRQSGRILGHALSDLWNYSANRIPEISDSIVEIDRAMRLGFNWEAGSVRTVGRAGVEPTVARMKKEGKPVAANVEKLLAAGERILVPGRSQVASGRVYFDLRTATVCKPVKLPQGVWSVSGGKEIQRRGEEEFRRVAGRSGRWRRAASSSIPR